MATNLFHDLDSLSLVIHILCAGHEVSVAKLADSRMASDRLRLVPAALAVQQSGLNLTVGDDIPSDADIVLVGKLKTYGIEVRQPRWLKQLHDFSLRGGYIVLDYTDHHLAITSPQSGFYSEVIGITNRLVVPGQAMKEVLSDQCEVPINVVEDRLEFGPLPPKLPEQYSDTALWFGHGSNLKFLAQLIQDWPSTAAKNLLILSGKGGDDLLRQYLSGKSVRIGLQYMEWSINSLLLAARRADVAVIPSNTDSHKKYASSNRLITSLTLGLPTVATTLPSYSEFRDCYADLGSHEGRATLAEPERGISGVRLFQENYMYRFLDEQIVQSWNRVFATCLN